MIDEDFRIKNLLGRKVEEAICLYYQTHVDRTAHLPKVWLREYDIVCPVVGNIEVKEDRLASQTGNYALEFQDFMGRPSGYAGTKALEFVIVDFDKVIMTRTENLAYLVRESKRKRQISMGDEVKGKQCMGWLLPREEILYSPFVEVVPRWFPHWRVINGKLC